MELISAPTRLMHSPSFRPQVTVNRTSIASNIKNPSWISPKSVYFQRNHTKIGPFCTKWSLNVRNEGFIGGERSGVGDRDGVIIVDHGSRRRESNLMLNEFVAMFRDKTGYPIVEPAHMELAEPSIKDAFYSCVLQGANRVIVSPFFLFPGRHWHQDIPSLAAEAAKEHPGVSYIITAPLGLHELMVNCMIRVWIEEATLAIYGHMLPHPANIHQPSDSTQHPVARMS